MLYIAEDQKDTSYNTIHVSPEYKLQATQTSYDLDFYQYSWCKKKEIQVWVTVQYKSFVTNLNLHTTKGKWLIVPITDRVKWQADL